MPLDTELGKDPRQIAKRVLDFVSRVLLLSFSHELRGPSEFAGCVIQRLRGRSRVALVKTLFDALFEVQVPIDVLVERLFGLVLLQEGGPIREAVRLEHDAVGLPALRLPDADLASNLLRVERLTELRGGVFGREHYLDGILYLCPGGHPVFPPSFERPTFAIHEIVRLFGQRADLSLFSGLRLGRGFALGKPPALTAHKVVRLVEHLRYVVISGLRGLPVLAVHRPAKCPDLLHEPIGSHQKPPVSSSFSFNF